MDDRRPAASGAQNPAYRPAHPPSGPLNCATATGAAWRGHIRGTCASAERLIKAARRAARAADSAAWPSLPLLLPLRPATAALAALTDRARIPSEYAKPIFDGMPGSRSPEPGTGHQCIPSAVAQADAGAHAARRAESSGRLVYTDIFSDADGNELADMAELANGPRGGGRDRDKVVQHHGPLGTVCFRVLSGELARFLCGQHGRRRRGVGSRTPAASCRIAATSGQPGCRTLGTFGPPRPQGGGEEPRRGSGGHYATSGGAGGSSEVALAQEFTSARGMISTSTSSPLSSMVATCPIFLRLPTMVGLPGLMKRTSS